MAVKKEKAAAAGDEVVVKYRDAKGQVAERSFNKEDHGDDFAEVAEQFKKTNASRLVTE